MYDENNVERARDTPLVVLCAPTGMAAFNIVSQTIHTVFHFPLNQSELVELSADVANSMWTSLIELRVIIIDKVSMVSERHLQWIDQ